jgi:flagellar basal-body rod modification protein FlgD
MASAVNSLFGSTATAGTTAATGTTSDTARVSTPPPSEEMFLKLLVSQMQNQDPLNPTDPTQMVSQLAQFSELEQIIAIRGDIEKAQSGNSAANGTNAVAGNPAATATGPSAGSAQPPTNPLHNSSTASQNQTGESSHVI